MPRILIALLLGLCAGSLRAQPLLNHTCEWFEESGGTGPGATTHSYYRYYINGDTSIGGQNYYQVFRQGMDSTWNTNGNTVSVTTFNEYSGALRDDEHRFFVVYRNTSSERLLVTFLIPEIAAGTPMAVFGGCGPAAGANITNLAALSLGTQSRPVYLAQGTVSAIIEGVGTTGGLFAEGSACLGFESYHRLVCFKKDNNLMSVNTARPCGLSVASEPDCQARFCYTRVDSAGFQQFTFYDQGTSRPGDPIIGSWLHFNGLMVAFQPGQPLHLTNPNPAVNPYVEARLSTAGGCYSSVTQVLTGTNTCTATAVGDLSATGSGCQIFPNPVRRSARLQCPAAAAGAEWRLFDGLGRQVAQGRVGAAGLVLDRGGLPDGPYFYSVTDKGRVLLRGKLLFVSL